MRAPDSERCSASARPSCRPAAILEHRAVRCVSLLATSAGRERHASCKLCIAHERSPCRELEPLHRCRPSNRSSWHFSTLEALRCARPSAQPAVPMQRVAMHAVRVEVLQAQAGAIGVPLWMVPIPSPCANEVYEQAMRETVARAVREGFTHVAFGDLFLEDIRTYREDRLAGSGLTPLFPLFNTDPTYTMRLARTMTAGQLRARITCLDPAVVDGTFAGREFDTALLDELPAAIDPCGERGEFHTCAYAGPMFNHPIAVSTGVTLARDGFVFTDLEIARQL